MTSPCSVIVIGAGGHARVVADALLCVGVRVLGFTDADPSRWNQTSFGLPILGGDDVLASYDPTAVCLANGLGMVDAQGAIVRRQVQVKLATQGWRFVAVRHPSAVISPRALLAEDVQVHAGAVIQAGASVEAGAIVNSRAVIEHDVRVGAWTHVAPGAVICGEAQIGSGAHIGAGAVVRQGIELGNNVLVGVGAAVVRHQLSATVLAGVPARPMDWKT
ncbi:MAG: NeuD/PglB/VioB family sugar acetyltransferase [Roseateles asaccharophilus]|uniref:UDP-perosamine 4-acetyltransferase n=1 Tax=Roseateles asaccharophilus TaxID=582607 RepID=A0A4R6MYB6_9BURK|nr:NeuD/PglB/VioB family sugar acetyltransferase [Roseateles asaccharophilus]MDN3545722.1 NeuD/PglB/VioB family sugar acetyltransferase [Roseateles asaccharophilus]TDP07590.1 UDP-perosamine 4-acetyltransferase [Roseateles asaccharophilus]